MPVDRTFAFVDLTGFTDFTERHREEEVAAVLAGFRTTARHVASRRGVRVAKWLGDGAMFVGVEPTPTVCAMLEVQARIDAESPLAVRTGMARGRVMLFEGDDYVGTAVNLAARLCDDAEPHELLTTPAVAEAAPRWAVVVPLGERAVRGFPHPVPVVRVCRPEPRDGLVRDPICLLDLPPEAAAASRQGPDGPVWFCSDSCAEAWDDAHAA
jgi:adenylate cyclase